MEKFNAIDRRSNSIIDFEAPDVDLGSAPALTRAQFLAIDLHYTAVLQGITEDEKLHAEFSNLFKIFQKSNIIQTKLACKVKELTSALAVAQGKNSSLEIKVQHDKEIIESLKKEVLHLEKTTSEAILEKRKMKVEFAEFIEKAKSLQPLPDIDDQEDTLEKRKISKLKKTLAESKRYFNEQIEHKDDECRLLKVDLEEKITDNNNLQLSIVQLDGEIKMRTKHLKLTKNKIMQLERLIGAKDCKLKTLMGELQNSATDNANLESTLKQYSEELKASQKEASALLISCENLQQQCREKDEKISDLVREKMVLQAKEKSWGKIIRSLRESISAFNNVKAESAKRIISLERHIMKAQEKIKIREAELLSTTQKFEETQQELGHVQNEIKELRHELHTITKESFILKDTIVELHGEIARKGEEEIALRKELEITRTDVSKEDILIHDLTFGKEILLERVKELNEKLNKVTHGLAEQERLANIYVKEIGVLNKELKKEDNQSGKVFLDYMRASKLNKEMNSEMSVKDKKIADLRQYVTNLKVHIGCEIEKNVTLRVSRNKLESRCVILKETVEKQRQEFLKNKAEIRQLEAHNKRHRKELRSRAEEFQKLGLQHLGLQTERKNDFRKMAKLKEEIKLYKEKMVILEMLLSRSEAEIRNQLGDIKLLNKTMFQRRKEINFLKQQSESCDVYKRHLIQLQDHLRYQQLKGKAFEEQVMRYVNIHRWRQLKGCDPERFQLIVKNQFLQKIVIRKTTLLNVKNAEVVKLQETMKHPRSSKSEANIDEARLSLVYREKLRKMRDKCDSLTSQVNMYHSHFKNYQNKIATLEQKLNKYEVDDYMQKLNKRRQYSKTEIKQTVTTAYNAFSK